MPYSVLSFTQYFKEDTKVSFISICWNSFVTPSLNNLTTVQCRRCFLNRIAVLFPTKKQRKKLSPFFLKKFYALKMIHLRCCGLPNRLQIFAKDSKSLWEKTIQKCFKNVLPKVQISPPSILRVIVRYQIQTDTGKQDKTVLFVCICSTWRDECKFWVG